MTQSLYIEDVYCDFFSTAINKNIDLGGDHDAATNFYLLIKNDTQLTKNQAGYLLKILRTHSVGLDIDNLTWKKEFRIIDNSKRICAILDDDEGILIGFQFPYSFLEKFDKEFPRSTYNLYNTWDPEKKLRKLKFYEHDLLKILVFCKENDFILDESFLELYNQAEEIWNQEDKIIPYCVVDKDSVILKNASISALEFFEENKTNSIKKDLITAKSMGYYLKSKSNESLIEKICSCKTNNFWIDDIKKFFQIFLELDTKAAVILDRNLEVLPWLQNFLENADSFDIPRTFIKVCFRQKSNDKDNINEWIKDQQVGGKLEGGKIFVFMHSPNKWFYNDIDSYKILLFNNVIPPTNHMVQALMHMHPLVMHYENIKPTSMREIEIETL
jgi:hypothetical protein